jgi:hypothetical protein
MRKLRKGISISHWILLSIVFLLGFVVVGCSKVGAAGRTEQQQITFTARFTNPVPIEPQPSEKCIACHTKDYPIIKLASDAVAGGHGGSGG